MSKRTVWTSAILALVACGLGTIYYLAHAFDPCDTLVKSAAKSPDGKKQVIVFERECGATVGFNTQASLAPVGRSFSADASPSFFAVAGRHNLAVSWISNSVVEVGVPKNEKIYKNEISANDVSIAYK